MAWRGSGRLAATSCPRIPRLLAQRGSSWWDHWRLKLGFDHDQRTAKALYRKARQLKKKKVKKGMECSVIITHTNHLLNLFSSAGLGHLLAAHFVPSSVETSRLYRKDRPEATNSSPETRGVTEDPPPPLFFWYVLHWGEAAARPLLAFSLNCIK